MLYQMRWKHLLTAFLTLGLASTIDVKIPENPQEADVVLLETRSAPQKVRANEGKLSFNLQAQAETQTRSRREGNAKSGQNKPTRTRSNQGDKTKSKESKPAKTRSNLGKQSDLERDQPIQTRSSKKVSNPIFRNNGTPPSNSKKQAARDRGFSFPKIRFRPVEPPNPYQTDFTPPPLPKEPKQKKPSYQLPKIRRDRRDRRPNTVPLPDTIQTLPLGSQEPFTSLDTAKAPNPRASGATRVFQVLAMSLLGVPIWFGLSKLKKAKFPSSSDS